MRVCGTAARPSRVPARRAENRPAPRLPFMRTGVSTQNGERAAISHAVAPPPSPAPTSPAPTSPAVVTGTRRSRLVAPCAACLEDGQRPRRRGGAGWCCHGGDRRLGALPGGPGRRGALHGHIHGGRPRSRRRLATESGAAWPRLDPARRYLQVPVVRTVSLPAPASPRRRASTTATGHAARRSTPASTSHRR